MHFNQKQRWWLISPVIDSSDDAEIISVHRHILFSPRSFFKRIQYSLNDVNSNADWDDAQNHTGKRFPPKWLFVMFSGFCDPRSKFKVYNVSDCCQTKNHKHTDTMIIKQQHLVLKKEWTHWWLYMFLISCWPIASTHLNVFKLQQSADKETHRSHT